MSPVASDDLTIIAVNEFGRVRWMVSPPTAEHDAAYYEAEQPPG
jgi:hypothetical protein